MQLLTPHVQQPAQVTMSKLPAYRRMCQWGTVNTILWEVEVQNKTFLSVAYGQLDDYSLVLFQGKELKFCPLQGEISYCKYSPKRALLMG